MANVNNRKVFDVAMSGNSNYHLKLTVTETSYDSTTNKSAGTWTLELYYLSTPSIPSYNLITSTARVTLNGVDRFNGRVNFDFRNYVSPQTLCTGSFSDVEHNADGTKTMSVYTYFDSDVTMTTGTINDTMALTTIPRASVFNGALQVYTLLPNSDNNKVSINYSKYVDSYTDKIVITLSNSTTITKTIDSNKNVYFTTSELNTMFNTLTASSTSVSGTVTLQTYNGQTLVTGGDSTPIWWYLAETSDTKPTITGSVSVSELNTTVNNLTGGTKFIKGYSNARVTFSGSATGKYNATISRYVLNDSITMSAISGGARYDYSNLDTSAFNVVAVDSRGFKSTTKSANVILITDYTVPTISNIVIERQGGVGTAVTLAFKGRAWNGNFSTSGNANTLTGFYYRVKQASSSTWGSWSANKISELNNHKTGTIDNFTISGMPLYANTTSTGFTLGTKYDIQFYIKDGRSTSYMFNSSEYYNGQVTDGKVLDGYYKSSTGYKIGLNGLPDTSKDDGAQVFGKLYLNGTEMSTDVPPKSHASNTSTYGLGTTSNYGHCRVINGLTDSNYADGRALSAYQGRLLKDLIDTLTPVTVYDNTTGIQSKNYITIDNITQYKRLQITFTAYAGDGSNQGGTGNTIWLDLTRPITQTTYKYCRCGVVIPYCSDHFDVSSPSIGQDFRALFEASLTNGRLYCLFAYGTGVQVNSLYVMTKVVGYKY